ncbi:mitochondrial 37S ribosomal protein rsm10 [Phlyctochytrium planicorne]|nr:mitochondrial 37S ribosomal protein rsm10 [Phlyctochytrium planicorne]
MGRRAFASSVPSQPYNNNSFATAEYTIPSIPSTVTSDQSKLVANIEVQGFMPDHLDFVGYFIRYSALARGLTVSSKVVHMPTKTLKWQVTRGPFVHDKSKEIFEQKTYRRLVQLFDASPSTVETFVGHVNSNLPSGVELHVERFDWCELNGTKKTLEEIVKRETEAQASNELLQSGGKSVDGAKGRSGRRRIFSEEVRQRAADFIEKNGGGKKKK